jgi:palmitoyltransferase ZDHHC9/14/18
LFATASLPSTRPVSLSERPCQPLSGAVANAHPARRAMGGLLPGRTFARDAYDGNNRLWLGGHSLTGPHLRGLVGSSVTMAATAALALGVTFPWLLQNRPVPGYSLLAAFLALLVTSLVSGWLTGTTDPGIIPRSAVPPPDIQRNPARSRERRLLLRGRTIVVKYCDTCRIWRPPHASHCSVCNNCVDRFDHHCPYCSGCIGRRNYRSFLAFVTSTAILATISLASSILHLVLKTNMFKNDATLGDALVDTLSDGPTAANFVVILVSFFGLAFTAGLCGFHLYLMWNNVTTAESFKKANRNSNSDEDEYRGLRAILYLTTVRRPPSRIAAGYDGPRYPDEAEIAALIEAQDEDDKLAQLQPQPVPPPPYSNAAYQLQKHPAGSQDPIRASRPPIVGRVAPAASRVMRLSSGFGQTSSDTTNNVL